MLLLLLATLWGASYSFIKIGVATIPPVTLIALRTLIAGGVLILVLRLRKVEWPRERRVWGHFGVQAVLNSVVPFTLIAWAETSIDAGLATILNATTPIFAFLLTLLITRHEPVTGRKLGGVVAGMVGTCLIVGTEALGGLGRELAAQLAILLASFSYGCAAIYSRNFKGLDPMLPAAGSMVCGALLLMPVSLIIDHPWTLSPSAPSLAALLALSVFCTALAFVVYFRLMASLGSVGTTAQAFLRVPIGVGFGMLLLGEMPGPVALAGLVCTLAGVIAMNMPARRVARSA